MFNWRQSSQGEPTRRLKAEARGEISWSSNPPTEPGYYIMVPRDFEYFSHREITAWSKPQIIYVGHGGDLGLLYQKYYGQNKPGAWDNLPERDKFTLYCGPLPDVPK